MQSVISITMKALSWNIRGMGRPEKRRKIRKLLLDKKIDVALLQETKRSNMTAEMVKSVWPRDNLEFITVDAEGLAGELLCLWDPAIFQLSGCCSNRNFILLSGKLLNTFACVIVNVHAPNDVARRWRLWETLLHLKDSFPQPWCIGGDFNEIRHLGERVGSSSRDKGMQEFNDFIDKSEMMDVQLIGRKYTWCNAFDGNKWSRIDRFLISPEWMERFKVKLWGLPRFVSDHCPIVLMEDERDWGPRPFRFLNAWFLHSTLAPLVEKTWKETQVFGTAGYILHRKLHALKLTLKI